MVSVRSFNKAIAKKSMLTKIKNKDAIKWQATTSKTDNHMILIMQPSAMDPLLMSHGQFVSVIFSETKHTIEGIESQELTYQYHYCHYHS